MLKMLPFINKNFYTICFRSADVEHFYAIFSVSNDGIIPGETMSLSHVAYLKVNIVGLTIYKYTM